MEKNKEQNSSVEQEKETITIGKKQFEGILERLENLEKGPRTEKLKRVTEHTARLRFHEDRPVIWYGNVREFKDKDTGKLVAWMDIKTIDDKIYKVEYLKFLNEHNSVIVRIKDQKVEEIVENYGINQAVNLNPVYNRKFQEFEYEDRVVSYKITATVEVLEGPHIGESYTLDTIALNA